MPKPFYDDYAECSFKYKHRFFSRPPVHFYIPGTEILEFFSYQSTGSSLTVQMPSNWYSSKLMVFAMCAVVAFKAYDEEDDISDYDQVNSSDGSCDHTNNFSVLHHSSN